MEYLKNMNMISNLTSIFFLMQVRLPNFSIFLNCGNAGEGLVTNILIEYLIGSLLLISKYFIGTLKLNMKNGYYNY